MSGFDTAFRTQAMLAPVQMEAGRRKNEGIAGIGQAAFGVAELMMRKAESDTRIAAFQQEQQLNQYKLQQLMTLDQAGLSRYSVDAARLQTEAAQYQFDEMKRRSEAMSPQEEAKMTRAKVYGSLVRPGGRFTLDDEGRLRVLSDEEREKDAALERSSKVGIGGVDPMHTTRRMLSQEMQRLQEQLRRPGAQRDVLQRALDQITSEYGSLFPGEQPGAAGPTMQPSPEAPQAQAPAAPAAPEQTPEQQQSSQIAYGFYTGADWEHPVLKGLGDESARKSVAIHLGRVGQLMVAHRAKQGVRLDPGQAHRYLMEQIRGGDYASVGLALQLEGYSNKQIEAYLGSFVPDAAKLAWQMKRLEEQRAKLLGAQ